MVILKSLKKQLNQFVTPEFETLVEDAATLVRSKSKSELPADNAYSHGLEDIYALENVDPSTIRKLGETDETSKLEEGEKESSTKKLYHLAVEKQVELNLGPEHSSYSPSFALNLPLNVLKISETALKSANKAGIRYLKDLIKCNWDELIQTKGVGQGHIEELQSSLKDFVAGRELLYSQTVDCVALLRSLLSEELLLKHHVHLKQYDLQDIVELSPVMYLELKRAPEEMKIRWVKESLSTLKTVDRTELVRSSIERVIMTFITPWLRKRKGFAMTYEVMDRLEQISEDTHLFDKILDCLSCIYFNQQPVISIILPTINDKIVFVDELTKQRFREVEQKILSYFYKPDLSYSMKELVIWVFRELASNWIDVDAQTIEKVITHSSVFKIWKNQLGELKVCLE